MKFAALALCVLGFFQSGCDALSKECTLIGCRDQATIAIQTASGTRPDLAMTLDIDGVTVECAAPVANGSTVCNSQVSVSTRELQACVEETNGSVKSLRCTGTGKFEQVVEIDGTPTAVHVTLKDGATAVVVAERAFQPQYMSVQPNGAGCEPTCRQWGTAWMLP